MRPLLASVVALGVVGLTGCNVAPPSCESAIGLAFIDKPPAVRTRMQRVSWRESRNVATAHRPGSQYYGCLQIGVRTHAARIKRLGFTAADMLRAWPNAVVARSLFNESGWSPWAATA